MRLESNFIPPRQLLLPAPAANYFGKASEAEAANPAVTTQHLQDAQTAQTDWAWSNRPPEENADRAIRAAAMEIKGYQGFADAAPTQRTPQGTTQFKVFAQVGHDFEGQPWTHAQQVIIRQEGDQTHVLTRTFERPPEGAPNPLLFGAHNYPNTINKVTFKTGEGKFLESQSSSRSRDGSHNFHIDTNTLEGGRVYDEVVAKGPRAAQAHRGMEDEFAAQWDNSLSPENRVDGYNFAL